MRAIFTLGLALAASVQGGWADEKTDLPRPSSLSATPGEFVLRGADNLQRILISGETAKVGDAATLDYSRQAKYLSSDPNVAVVTRDGVVVPRGNGTAQITATFGEQQTVVKATVTDFSHEPPVSFRNQVVPIFTKLGCNSGGCHGKAARAERLQAVAARLRPRFRFQRPRQGSPRPARVARRSRTTACCCSRRSARSRTAAADACSPTGAEYALLRRWIQQGTPKGSRQGPAGHAHRVLSRARVVGRHAEQQMLVTAFYSDGTSRDVTHEAQFKSNETNLAVVDDARPDPDRSAAPATPSVMARYMGQVDVCKLSIPLAAVPRHAADRPAFPGRTTSTSWCRRNGSS